MIYMMCGNVGTGKTTTARRLREELGEADTVVLSHDSLCAAFNDGNYNDYCWDRAHIEIYLEAKYAAMKQALRSGFNVIIDGCYLPIEHREECIRIANSYGEPLYVYYHPHSSIGLERRKKEPRGYNPEKWDEIHQRQESSFEIPTIEEGIEEIIIIDSDGNESR